MKIVLFYHSLVSDWNHGNAHFLRGVATNLIQRGHDVLVYEPKNAWSVENLVAEQGTGPIEEFHARYPLLQSHAYELPTLDLDRVLNGADMVIVHEWNDHALVRRIGEHHAATGSAYQLFFHDTHHRAVTSPDGMAGYDLSHYDGVLAYGNVLRDLYLARGWTPRAWTWHEAADTEVFHPLPPPDQPDGDVVWVGNWGDDERTAELREFLIDPIAALGLRAQVFGVRYPAEARELLRGANIRYGGWLPNYRAPEVFSRYKVTVHVPRRPYVEALPGIPTIRPFEALACGIPLVCSPWNDAENLFTPGRDFLVAQDGQEMKKHLRALLADKQMARELSTHGLETIRARHTCAHRVDELLKIHEEVRA
jgi:spore maturation protein CgeB